MLSKTDVDKHNQQLYPIDWAFMVRAQQFYHKQGFEYVELPWMVPREIIVKTYPPGADDFSTEYGHLVGSAEQAFLYRHTTKPFSEGWWMSQGPCFRGDTPDAWHNMQFMKLELFCPYACEDTAYAWAEMAKHFFDKEIGNTCIIQTAVGWDLECDGIELGSYGVHRQVHNSVALEWTYGTGIAEPRASLVNAKMKMLRDNA